MLDDEDKKMVARAILASVFVICACLMLRFTLEVMLHG